MHEGLKELPAIVRKSRKLLRFLKPESSGSFRSFCCILQRRNFQKVSAFSSFLSYRNQSTDLQSKSRNWFLYDRDRKTLYSNLLKIFRVIYNRHIKISSYLYRILRKYEKYEHATEKCLIGNGFT